MLSHLFAPAVVLAMTHVFATTALDGVFALAGATPKTHGHALVTKLGPPAGRRHFQFWLTADGSQTVGEYDLDMTKYMHLVVIDDGFTSFQHLHPTLGADHRFRIVVAFPKPGFYHLFADCDARGIGKQVFRYDLPVGDTGPVTRDLPPTGSRVRADGYDVTLSTTDVRAGAESAIAVHVTERGKPSRSLRPYLGAPAHAVIIGASDLSYAHVHPMPLGPGNGTASEDMRGMQAMSDMGAMPDMPGTTAPASVHATSSPDMLLHVSLARPGTYELWLQFRSTSGLHVAPFVLTAR